MEVLMKGSVSDRFATRFELSVAGICWAPDNAATCLRQHEIIAQKQLSSRIKNGQGVLP
jgi:hypothetical protein